MWSVENINLQGRFVFLEEELKKRTGNFDNIGLTKTLSRFKSEYKTRFEKAFRKLETFFKTNNSWLETSVSFLCCPKEKLKRGRPSVSFDESSERTKRMKTEKLRESTSISMLSFATQMSLRAVGQVSASKVLKDITTTTPDRAKKYRKSYKESLEPKSCKMSGQEALGVAVEAQLSRHQYNVIRMSAPEKFPAYKVLQAAKQKCYPPPECIEVSETLVKVTLQALLDLTTKRLLESQMEVIGVLTTFETENLSLFCKWGFDGSSGHSSYKQAFHGLEATDSSVFITCVVPLRLSSSSRVVWQNPRPGSTRYCRPLKIEFVKESTQMSIAEKNRVENEVKNLRKTTMLIEEREVQVNHTLLFTMIDGKVCNAITETSSTQKCFICGASSRSFNDIDSMLTREVKTENLEFGLSVLHGWIRFFENLLHLAYKLPLKKWQARGDDDKIVVAENKKRIQKEFKDRCGLIIDKPKPGFGNSNDGNTARRFFQNPEISAEITKIDVQLIKKMHIIMIVVASGYEIDVEEFKNFAIDTARYYVEKYPWYYMSPTLHKYFIHGPEIIAHALLPIGQLSEEAQESRNKDFKNYREHHSRKSSRENTNRDIFNSFLLSSDPIITSMRKLPEKQEQHIPIEALSLLKAPPVDNTNSEVQEDSSDEERDDLILN